METIASLTCYYIYSVMLHVPEPRKPSMSATLMTFFFTQTKQLYMVRSAFDDGQSMDGPVKHITANLEMCNSGKASMRPS